MAHTLEVMVDVPGVLEALLGLARQNECHMQTLRTDVAHLKKQQSILIAHLQTVPGAPDFEAAEPERRDRAQIYGNSQRERRCATTL